MLNSIIGTDLTLSAFLICTAASLVLGIGLAFVSQFRARSTQSFAVTLAILPMVVQVVIMLVNGNIGAGVAVAGAFSLVRFRSAPGTAREIGVLFLGMAIGLATGMGYVGLAALTFVIVSTALLALTALGLGQKDGGERLLKITIPEDLEYDGVFDEVLNRYAAESELTEVTTTNMGSLFQLTYQLRLRERGLEKAMIDELRCLNGNLKISLGMTPQGRETL